MATTVIDVVHESPIGNLLHLLIFLAGAGVIGIVALAVIERLAEGDAPSRIGVKHLSIAIGGLVLLIAVEVAFHVLGGS